MAGQGQPPQGCYHPRVRRSFPWPALALLTLASCDCGGAAETRVDGPTPYVRYHLEEPSGAAERRVGGLTLRRTERTLTIEGLPSPFRLAVAAGPAGRAPEADLIALIGGAPSLEADAPVLWLDGPAPRQRIEDDDGGIIDATPLRLIRAGPLELVPVPGTPEGRYGEGEPCGLGDDDVGEWELEAPSGPRLVLSWAGPAGHPETRGLLGVDAGSELVARIMSETSATGAIFAWPSASRAWGATDSSADLVAAVGRAEGPPTVRADGARTGAGWTLFEVAEGGVARLDRVGGTD